jgi:hypothetical protein
MHISAIETETLKVALRNIVKSKCSFIFDRDWDYKAVHVKERNTEAMFKRKF